MAENLTRVVLSNELNEIIDAYVKKQKGKNGVTKILVLQELCKAGLEFQEMVKRKDAVNYSTDSQGLFHPDESLVMDHLAKGKHQLKLWQKSLDEKENRLLKKEEVLLIKERILEQKQKDRLGRYEKELITREANIAFKEKMKTDTLSGGSNKFLEDRIKEQQGTISDLRNEVKELKEERRKTMREIISALNIIKSNTQSNVWTDTILPLITPAISLYMISRISKQETGRSNQGLESIFNEILNFVPADKREIIKKAFADAVKASQKNKNEPEGANTKKKPGGMGSQ